MPSPGAGSPGTLWPMPPTQVADFAAVAIGLVVVLWLCRMVRGLVAVTVVALVGLMLLQTHSRTELIAMIAGILVASTTLFTANSRAPNSSRPPAWRRPWGS